MPHADVKKRFGLVIKTWRGKSSLSQEELAWRAGLHRSYVADIERGARNASLQTIEKLARALNVSFSTLFQPFGDLPVAGGTARTDDRVNILLVEDNRNDADLTIAAFRQANVKNHIHVVHHGAGALDYLFGANPAAEEPLNNHPRLILLDLDLPEVSGLEVLRRIKRDARSRTIPVVVLTGSDGSRELRECKRLGAEIHLPKPIDIHRFCEVIPRLSCYWALFISNEQDREAMADEVAS
jgi:CheY-like chemotaxis protein/DNA-binding XRE family transcriptional regulator